MRPPRTPPYAGSLVPFGGEARVRAGPFRRGVAGLRRAASCLALARAAEDLGFAVPAALAPADLRLAVVPDLAAVAALPATAFGLAVVFGFTVVPALAALLALPVVLAFAVLAFAILAFAVLAFAVLAFADAGFGFAAGLATDIVFAAAVRALAAVVIAFVAVFIACMAMDIVLADEVAFVAAAVILVAAEVTLVAAEDTVRAAAIAVGAALLAAERVVFAAVVLQPVLAFGRAAAPFAAGALVDLPRAVLAVPRRAAARVIVFAGTELPPS